MAAQAATLALSSLLVQMLRINFITQYQLQLDKLKELFDNKLYSQVDLTNISMTTEGMGTGSVVFKLNMPFVHVKDRCDAFTSFDHCGGWNQTPALASRKRQRSSALLIGEELDISELKQTDEGLQKYWI